MVALKFAACACILYSSVNAQDQEAVQDVRVISLKKLKVLTENIMTAGCSCAGGENGGELKLPWLKAAR